MVEQELNLLDHVAHRGTLPWGVASAISKPFARMKNKLLLC